MRFVRPLSGNKENFQPAPHANQSCKIDQLKKQLKQAYAQIHLLKKCNQQLITKLQFRERQTENMKMMKQELQFLKQQDQNIRHQLQNYEEINKKLRDQLEKNQNSQQRIQSQFRKAKGNESDVKNTSRHLYQTTEQGRFSTTRTCSQRSSLNTSMSERGRSNHSSTPKSKMNINWQQMMPGQIPERRKVFL